MEELNAFTGILLLILWIGIPILVLMFPFFLILSIKSGMAQSPKVTWRKREVKVRDDYGVQDIGWLLDELHFGNRHTRPLTFAALADVLPQLKPHDAHRVTAHHHGILDTLIDSFVSLGKSSAQEVVLCLAILKAMENIGEAGDEWHVQHLALSARLPQIREAALATLPLLQARIRENLTINSLLRASQEPAVAANTLLRPALEQEDAHPESLLRPR